MRGGRRSPEIASRTALFLMESGMATVGTVFRASVLAILLGGVALTVLAPVFAPVLAQETVSSFFSPSDKYQKWFKETPNVSRSASTAKQYPYPDKSFVMSDKQWRKSTKSIVDGRSNWFDAEVIRHRADVEEYPPAMDFLAWMYQEGRGVDRDNSKAFMWYERAKMAGVENLSGSSAKIFERLSENEKYYAELQLAEDIEAVKSGKRKGAFRKEGDQNLDSVHLRVMKKMRDPNYYKKLRLAREKKEKDGR
ncbi:MAG: SEL1-like repeat protein [Alphaproteobacteria bacterium]|nr:SEL1-like repeat protein [Alphaproteobacteria bacterium]